MDAAQTPQPQPQEEIATEEQSSIRLGDEVVYEVETLEGEAPEGGSGNI